MCVWREGWQGVRLWEEFLCVLVSLSALAHPCPRSCSVCLSHSTLCGWSHTCLLHTTSHFPAPSKPFNSMRLLRPQALVQEEAIRYWATTTAYRCVYVCDISRCDCCLFWGDVAPHCLADRLLSPPTHRPSAAIWGLSPLNSTNLICLTRTNACAPRSMSPPHMHTQDGPCCCAQW